MATIAISANTSWYLYNFRKNTILALIKQGFIVIAIAPEDEYSDKLLKLGCQFIHINIDQGGTNPVKDVKTFFDFYHIYKTTNIDVVLNFTPKNNIYSTLAAHFNNTKAINNIAGLGILFINESITSKIAKFLYKISQSKASKLFFQNEEDRQLFLENKITTTVPTDRLPGSGVDLSRFTLSPAPDDNKVRFLLIARMLYDKGIQQYVDAARNLKQKYGTNVELCLLGFLDVNNPSAVSTVDMNSWVEEGIINYLGVSDNVEQEIAKVDCMVLPSYYREGVPKSLLEAGSMGKPIVTTDSVGCRETVDDGINGYLCEPRSSESLTEKLSLIIEMSHEQRLEMGLKSREKIQKEFDEKIVINKYLAAVDVCIQNKMEML
ncbi:MULTISPECIES: glycosyltransferase family 4 protein [unclassified Colwellia]|uniref:glycosyltransferase family 4 protein n=1 Tax=unclassified Colwellia TaxID=196834 RepID=UPI0015F3F87B|nr:MULTISPECIES: glycosyltransferase family 4 protein [unclassified Colwellia]MBA6381218.1 glycosyltransferase family 4 protein [Colwellia sp. BRX10-7]MBA6388931.1 glycosyltransferase family 4 protein [Colwellia sp. BRX10-2]MBA6399998.1 glycosyltransferase family 4 protein [Colwellia sp. BRX10-5]MBA6403877.1 glycosyltransferase family 4 protein [Colwellia sp. BRX10-1]